MTNYLDGEHWRTAEITSALHQAATDLINLQIIEKLNPKFSKDGNQFCFLYGENLQEGIAGFGSTVFEAVNDFCKSYYQTKA